MTNKEISIRSIIFLIIGILLVLSLVICIYIVNDEKDLIPVKATVINIKEDKDATGKNDITVVYDVGKTTYQYNFYYKDGIKIDDEIEIYYHEKEPTSVQTNKTSKLIFFFPIVGIILCIFGLFELFTKHRNDEESIKDLLNTKVIDEDDKTQTIKILNESSQSTYKETEEEKEEVPVKKIRTKSSNIMEEDTNTIITNIVEEENNEITKVTKVLPSQYGLDNGKISYIEKGKKEEFINIEDIEKLIKTINSEKKIVKITVKTKNITCIFTNMENINIEKFAEELHNNIKRKNKNLLEEIEYKEW